jgi:hypothetical protein
LYEEFVEFGVEGALSRFIWIFGEGSFEKGTCLYEEFVEFGVEGALSRFLWIFSGQMHRPGQHPKPIVTGLL